MTAALTFHAGTVVTEHPDGDCLLVGFADEPLQTTHYLMLQRSFEDDEQDVALGLNTYHVEVDDASCSGYGGIARLTLHRERLNLLFADTASQAPGGQLNISFELDDLAFQQLRSALGEIFQGEDCLHLIA